MKSRLAKVLALVIGICIVLPSGRLLAQALTLDMVKDKVDAAAKLIESDGEAAFVKLRDKNGEFRFGGGEGYIFVNSPDGFCMVHGEKQALEGKFLLELKDINGVYFFVQFNEVANKFGKGWVGYMWPKPGQKDASPKFSYIVLAKKDGKKYVVGSGLYNVTKKDIKAKYPDDKIFED